MARRARRGRKSAARLVIVVIALLLYALYEAPKSAPTSKLILPLAVLLGIAALALVLIVSHSSSAEDSLHSGDRIEPWLGEHSIDTTKWSVELLRKLEWRRFEELCVAFFQALGFRAKSTRFGADGGIDINLFTKDATFPSILVQCKAWNTYSIGVKAIRELRGVMAERKVEAGVFVTSATFTAEARSFAESQNIRLLDGPDFIRKILALPIEQQKALLDLATRGDFRTPTCPSCGVKMTARKSAKDGKAFWGCVNYPRCRQTFFGKANAPLA